MQPTQPSRAQRDPASNTRTDAPRLRVRDRDVPTNALTPPPLRRRSLIDDDRRPSGPRDESAGGRFGGRGQTAAGDRPADAPRRREATAPRTDRTVSGAPVRGGRADDPRSGQDVGGARRPADGGPQRGFGRPPPDGRAARRPTQPGAPGGRGNQNGRPPLERAPRGIAPGRAPQVAAAPRPADATAAPAAAFRRPLDTGAIASFDQLALRPEVRAAVRAMGITVPTPIQAQAIPAMLAGEDVVGQARTGSGKTLAFGLPTVERCDPTVRGVQALILVPTRELAIQVGSVVEKLAAARRLRLMLLYGGRSLLPEQRALAAGAQIVVGTPGRTLDHLRQGNLALDNLRIFILDEGDEMLDRGFAPDVERILARTPARRQTALFSATVPPWVMQTATRHLHDPVLVRVDTTEAPPDIAHVVYDVDATTRSAALRTLLDRRADGPIIVFGRTKHGVKKLAKQLQAEGFPVVALHGNLSQNARERAMTDLRSGQLPILVATNVAARGIDIADVGQVINYEVPESAELFTHRVGRTGRMGKSGEAITFVTPDEAPKWRQIERALGKTLPRQPWLDGERVDADTAAAATSRAPIAPPAQVPAARATEPAAPRVSQSQESRPVPSSGRRPGG